MQLKMITSFMIEAQLINLNNKNMCICEKIDMSIFHKYTYFYNKNMCICEKIDMSIFHKCTYFYYLH